MNNQMYFSSILHSSNSPQSVIITQSNNLSAGGMTKSYNPMFNSVNYYSNSMGFKDNNYHNKNQSDLLQINAYKSANQTHQNYASSNSLHSPQIGVNLNQQKFINFNSISPQVVPKNNMAFGEFLPPQISNLSIYNHTANLNNYNVNKRNNIQKAINSMANKTFLNSVNYRNILSTQPDLPWASEIHSENKHHLSNNSLENYVNLQQNSSQKKPGNYNINEYLQ